MTTTGDKTVNAWLRGCLSGAGLQLIIAPVITCYMVGCMAVMLPVLNDMPLDSPMLFLWAALFVAALMLPLVLTLVVAVVVVNRQNRGFDAAFAPLGLVGSAYAVRWRRYRGTVNGRVVTTTVIRGLNVTLHLQAEVQKRLALGTRTPLGTLLAGAINAKTLDLSDPDYRGRVASSEDSLWARGIFADEEAKAALLRLTQDISAVDIRTVYTAPGEVVLSLARIPLASLTDSAVRGWLDDLTVVARAVEA